MKDDSFTLTPVDVRHYDFGKALRGYDPGKVEQFRDDVVAELERLNRLNQELDTKAKGFHEQLRAFRERDKALNEALVAAQQLRAEIREQAEREAQLILREARAEGERLLDGVRGEIRQLQGELGALEKSRRAYVRQVRSILERQLAELEAADGAVNVQPALPAEAEPVSEPAFKEPRSHAKTPAWLDSLVKE
jgi:DivIVA domain-containing protein